MKKQILKHVLGLVAMVALFCSFATVEAFAGVSGDFTYGSYRGDSNAIEITAYNGKGGDVVVPATIDGKTVKAIGWHAFEYCTSIESVTLPKTIEEIGYFAFKESSITSITIPEGVTAIRSGAFLGCESLVSATLPESLTTLESLAFGVCKSLTEITIPKRIKDIGEGTFSACYSLASVTLPEGLKSIGNTAFSSCRSLTVVAIPDSVWNIDREAFAYCENLHQVIFRGKGVPFFGEDVFRGTSAKLQIYVPEDAVPAYQAEKNLRNVADRIFGY